MKTIPPELANDILQTLQDLALVLIGWVGKWLQNRKKINNLKNQIK